MTGLHAARNAASHAVQQNWEYIFDEAGRINELRYSPSVNWSQSDAQTFLQKLRDPPGGVLAWRRAQPCERGRHQSGAGGADRQGPGGVCRLSSGTD